MMSKGEREVPDLFVDRFIVESNPFGALIALMRTDPGTEEGPSGTKERLAHVRMTMEHLKAFTFMLWRHVVTSETGFGVRFEMPTAMLEEAGITESSWNAFWYSATVDATPSEAEPAEAAPAE
jgi:hypothetical protein